jgi:hypothetical protein
MIFKNRQNTNPTGVAAHCETDSAFAVDSRGGSTLGLSTFAVLNIHSTRASIRLQNSVRQLAGYLEKARLDAIRRTAIQRWFSQHHSYDITWTSRERERFRPNISV